jgi:N-acetylmuramic acid 6-phosphate etherase
VTQPIRHQLDLMSSQAIVDVLLDAEERVVPAVRAVSAAITAAAELVAQSLRDGGRVAFLGAGTSGRIALAEAAELPGTFGLAVDDVLLRVAGMNETGRRPDLGSDRDEDDVEAGVAAVDSMKLSASDVLIAVAASGRTPYTVAAAGYAEQRRVPIVAVVNSADSPLAALADVAIEILVGPEVLRGSTRLTAGTAQKLALNAMTTAAMVRLGRVHGDVMVDVVAANEKLRQRVVDLVHDIASCPPEEALAALVACDWNARAAVLQLMGGLAPDAAVSAAADHLSLRAAITAQRP